MCKHELSLHMYAKIWGGLANPQKIISRHCALAAPLNHRHGHIPHSHNEAHSIPAFRPVTNISTPSSRPIPPSQILDPSSGPFAVSVLTTTTSSCAAAFPVVYFRDQTPAGKVGNSLHLLPDCSAFTSPSSTGISLLYPKTTLT